MSTGAVAAVVVAVLIVIAIVAALTMSRGGGPTGGLKHRFGPEYDRTLAQHGGDVKATRKELSERVKRYAGIERNALSPADRERYAQRWSAVQGHFVEDPGQAVAEADRLIAELARDRGFPAAGSPEHFDALSVHHAHQVQGYRQAHALAEHAGAGGRRATEDLRLALVAARELFNELLAGEPKSAIGRKQAPAVGPAPDSGSGRGTKADAGAGAEAGTEARAVGPEAEPVAAAPAADAGPETDPAPYASPEPVTGGRERQTLGHRFAALTGSSRKGHDDDAERP